MGGVTQPDIPADLAKVDEFGHQDYAVSAAEVLLAAEAPFTLGIFGDWGIGKTTIVHGIRDVVEKAGAAFVEFDVWRYEDDAFRRQFLREVASQLQDTEQLNRWGWRRRWRRYEPSLELRDLEADVPVPEESVRVSWKALLAAALHFTVIFAPAWFFLRHTSIPHDLWGKNPVRSSAAEVAAAVIAAIVFLHTLVSRIVRVDQRYVTIRRIEEPERFEAKFRDLLELTKASRVVVAIDDLDRCKPELVDKFLAMLKTYIEPVAHEPTTRDQADGRGRKGADAVFVISADEAAVRRHMIARELESIPQLASFNEQEQLRQAEYQVDEYLRKFFNAVIRVRPILPEDIKRFTTAHLSKFFDDHIAYEDDWPSSRGDDRPDPHAKLARLVAMVAGALRKNPRRIKQFVQNLDARVRTIKHREVSGRIAPGISRDILGIAKIAIIEEEWRDEYDELELNPRLLGEWQTKAVGDGLPNRDLRSFLQFNRDITPLNVEAVVNLKLEADDLALPDFGVFRDAVAYADFDTAREVISRAPEEYRTQYAVRLPDLLARELGRDGFVEARNVVDAALQDRPLGLADRDEQERMVADALAYPPVVQQFLTLDPSRLFVVLDGLPADDQRQARKPFLNLQSAMTSPPSTENVGRVAEELAIRVNQLDEDEKRELEQSISQSQHLRSSWLPLAEADPALLSESAVNDAFQAMMVGVADPDAPEFRVGLLGFTRRLGQQFYTPYLDHLTAYMPTASSEPGRLRPFLSVAAATLSEMPVGVDPSMQQLVATIRTAIDPILAALGTDGVLDLFRLSASANHLDAVGAPTAAQEARQITADLLPRHSDLAAQAAIADPSALDGQVLASAQAWFDNAARITSPAATSWSAAVNVLMAIGEDARPIVADALSRSVSGGQPAEAAVGLQQLLFGPNGRTIGGWLTQDDFSRVVATLGSEFDSGLVTQLDVLDYTDTVLGSLAYLVSHWESLATGERLALGNAVKKWLSAEPAASEDLARALDGLSAVRVADRKLIVQGFLSAAHATADEAVRDSAIRAASRFAGESKQLTRLVPPAL